MIIDAKAYNGACGCGKSHEMQTKICIIEAGALKNIKKYLSEIAPVGKSCAIYDENTYRATEGRHPAADFEIILSPEGLHADNEATDLALSRIPADTGYLIAVGAGTVHDITRYSAAKLGLEFISCPTAASVDGFCSSVAAMTWHGFKKTFSATAPMAVIADLDIIAAAPKRLSASGFGDMIGKFISLSDWRVSHVLTGEYLCERIYGMTLDATRAVMAAAEGIALGSHDAYEKLTYGLLMSGLAMQLLTNSRCASGAEHHVSHLIEMQPEGLGVSSDALHGEKVGVGTLIAAGEYHRIRNISSPVFGDYEMPSEDSIRAVFGSLSTSIIEENSPAAAEAVKSDMLASKWDEICAAIDEIPTVEELMPKYELLGMRRTLSDIDVDEGKLSEILDYSPLVRNRITLMRLRRSIKEAAV